MHVLENVYFVCNCSIFSLHCFVEFAENKDIFVVNNEKPQCIVTVVRHNNKAKSRNYYTIMDFLLSKYGLIFTEFDSIDRGGAEVNTFKFSKYQTIFTE